MPTTPVEFTKIVGSSATPEQLQTSQTLFREATLIGKNAARTNNTGTVYLGITAEDDTQFINIAPGETISLTAPEKAGTFDFQDWYLDVDTNNDGVYVLYW